MKFIMLAMLIPIGLIGVVQSQEHVHGQGSVFVIQDKALWQIQYVLPASDVLGFEHKSESQQQVALLAQLNETLKDFENLMKFDAKCVQTSYSHNLREFKNDEHSQGHDEHENHHSDIEIFYNIKCEDDAELLTFSIFNKMSSLQTLKVQWSLNSNQGTAVVGSASAELELQ